MANKLTTKITTGVTALIIGLGNLGCGDLTEKDFTRKQWIPYQNTNGEIWNEYLAENIAHNADNWKTYEKQVKKYNKKDELTGYILLPDLDENGVVGSSK